MLNQNILYFKLSLTMFLQFFIWGAWYTSVSTFMAAEGMTDGIYWVYTAGPLGAIIAPFFIGLIADRFFNTEKLLGVLFILSGISLFILPNFASQGSLVVNSFILVHMLFYMPTLALTASLSFKHLEDGEKRFPFVRVWGTIGWIIAGIVISIFTAEKTALQFTIAGSASILLGIFSFSLPKTPAPKKGEPIDITVLFFKDAWVQLKKPSFLIFIICSFLVCIPLAAYYAYLQLQMGALGIEATAAAKTLGQGSEIIFMLLMPFFFKRLGVKYMVAIGIFAWVLRYILFALGTTPDQVMLIYLGLILHGICYDFFFVTGQIYVDKVTPKAIRGQAQAMIVFFTQGLGLYFGAIASGYLFKKAFPTEVIDETTLDNWGALWYPLAIFASVILVIFLIAFKHKDENQTV